MARRDPDQVFTGRSSEPPYVEDLTGARPAMIAWLSALSREAAAQAPSDGAGAGTAS